MAQTDSDNLRYIPTVSGAEISTAFLQQEFQKIAAALNNLHAGYREVLHTEPTNIQLYMRVVADGTDWNPGAGAGVYELTSIGPNVWTKL